MSVFDFLNNGGFVIENDLFSNEEKERVNNILKSFFENIKKISSKDGVSFSQLSIHTCSFVAILKDQTNYTFILAKKSSSNGAQFSYNDLSQYHSVDIRPAIKQIENEIGKIIFTFTHPMTNTIDDRLIEEKANEYLLSQNQNQKVEENKIKFPEISLGLNKFAEDHPINTKTAFIIMNFEKTNEHDQISTSIKSTLKEHNIIGLRADDKEYMDDLFLNIKVYMHACNFGIAVFDRIKSNVFNPNVSLEIGYMMGMGKPVLLLKDQTLDSLTTDLTGKLYKSFDTRNIQTSIVSPIKQWLCDYNFVKPTSPSL